MKKRKRLGIWMDDLDAHLMDFKTDIIELNTIESTFVHPEKFEEEDKRKRQVKQKREHNKFHKDLSETIKYYDEVIIFGSSESKKTLVNILSSNNKFSHIKIAVKDIENLTESQQHNFVKEFFLKNDIYFRNV